MPRALFVPRALLTCLALLIWPALLHAQAQTTGNVRGKVADESGGAVVGATVTIVSVEFDLTRTATTSDTGEFLVSKLPVGNYALSVEAQGLQAPTANFRLEVGQTVPIEIVMAAGAVAEEQVTVYGVASRMETPSEGENFSYEEEVDVLPMLEREIEDVAVYSPNISYGPTPGTIAISGAPSYDTVVLLDGAEISDPFFGSGTVVYIEDAIEELQVITQGVSARYGRFGGGVLNAVTKSGTNELDITVRGEFENQSWNGQTPFEETQADDVQRTLQGTAGGYLWKDHVWFFGGIRDQTPTELARTATRTRETFLRVSENDRWQAKLRGALGRGGAHVFDASHLEYEATSDPYEGLTAGDVEALGQRFDPRETNTVSYQGVLGQQLFAEAQLTEKKVSIFSGGDPGSGHPFIDNNTATVFNNHWWDFTDPSVRDNETGAVNVVYTFDTGRLGSHTLEGGVQRVESIIAGDNRQSSTGRNLLFFDPGFFAGVGADGRSRFNVRSGFTSRWVALEFGADQRTENTAVYLQDQVSWGKWRLDAGLRYERYEGSGALEVHNLDTTDLSPRLGLTYNVTDDWQVLGTYGRYVSRFNDNYSSPSTGINGAPRISSTYIGPSRTNLSIEEVEAVLEDDSPANWRVTGATLPFGGGLTMLAEDVESPHADEITFSVRRALPRSSGTLALSYVNRQYQNPIESFQGDVCAQAREFGFSFPGQEACPASNVSVATFDGVVYGIVDTTVYANHPDATRDYQAFTLTGDYRPSQAWSLGGNYTYAWTRGNYEGEGRNTPASASALGNFPRSLPQGAAAPYGFVDDDIRHRLNVFATYRHLFGRAGDIAIGAVLRAESGQPWSKLAAVPIGNDPGYVSDGVGTYNHFFEGRGSERFDGWWAGDLSATYTLPLLSELDVFIKGAITNVTNEGALVVHQTSGVAVNSNGALTWAPAGNCSPATGPSRGCESWGRIRNEVDYQLPREVLVSVGLEW